MSDKNDIDYSFSLEKVKKGIVLQRAGDKKLKAYHVVKGLLKSYFIDEKGNEHIFMFAPQNWFVLDVELLSNKKDAEAILYIETLEDSELEVYPASVFTQMDKLSNDMLVEQINELINRVCVLQRRIYSLMSSSAESRYDEFIATYPQIRQRVSLKMIASYLGITPETLSVVRNKKKNQGS